jgi:hypothetical protein
MSNTAKWESWFGSQEGAFPFGDTITYQLGADFLSDCDVVEDWGCGAGWMRKFVPAERYIGLDGSPSRFSDRVVDLETYRSDVSGIFMRHVLEHNYRWESILENALVSFRHRFVLVTFVPHGEVTRVVGHHELLGVPDISIAKGDIIGHFTDVLWRDETLTTETQYGTETIFFVERVSAPSDHGRWRFLRGRGTLRRGVAAFSPKRRK